MAKKKTKNVTPAQSNGYAKDTHERRIGELARLQKENDLVEKLPDELVLALTEARSLDLKQVDEINRKLADGVSHEEIVAAEKERLDELASAWRLDRQAVGWLQCSPFMAEFTRWIRKRAVEQTHSGMKVDTAAAIYNPKTEEVEIAFNPRFMCSIVSDSIDNGKVDPNGAGVFEHEHFHVMLRHLTSRRRQPAPLWNIATDLAINSLIARCDTMARLPGRLLLPGLVSKFPIPPNTPPDVVKAQESLTKIIGELPQEMTSEWYFQEIKRRTEEDGYTWGKKGMIVPGDAGPDGEGHVLWESDNHDGWDDVPEEIRDLVEGKIKHALRQACGEGDNRSNGWGNIPQSLREEIRAIAFGSVDWRSVLRNWVGSRNAGGRSRSIKRIDRRFPYQYPGLKRSRNPWIDVYVDQSGSVDDHQLARIFGALEGCSKHTSFRVIPFDHTVADDQQFVWKRGQKPKLERVRGGGTSFDAVIAHANDPKRRGMADGIIICTDGECSKPPPSRIKLAWLVTPGHKLMFEPNQGELLISMNENDRDDHRGKW